VQYCLLIDLLKEIYLTIFNNTSNLFVVLQGKNNLLSSNITIFTVKLITQTFFLATGIFMVVKLLASQSQLLSTVLLLLGEKKEKKRHSGIC